MIDVVIVGGGPSGTAAAYELLENGFSVLILDKYQFPRKKACAGGITPKGMKLYQFDISSMIHRTCYRLKLTAPNGHSFDIHSEEPLCYMTQRNELDHFSLNRVLEKGARFEVIQKITRIQEQSSKIVIETENNQYQCRYLIGADGSNSKVRQFIANKGFQYRRPALEADVRVKNPEHYPMSFDFSVHKKGYFWIFPKEKHINVGLYSFDINNKPKLSDLKAAVGSKIGNFELEAVKGYPIHTAQFSFVTGTDRILLAGDAAGLAEPVFGEGIYFALKSGQAAAETIISTCSGQIPLKKTYRQRLKPVLTDLKIYNAAAILFYRFPGFSLKVASHKAIKNHFAKGFSKGDNLINMFKRRYTD